MRPVVLGLTSTLSAGLLSVGLLLLPGSAAAVTTGPVGPQAAAVAQVGGPDSAAAGRDCRMLRALDHRFGKVQTRLTGPATTKGSIAWVKAAAAAASNAGEVTKAKALTDRAAAMDNRLTVLRKLGPELGGLVRTHC